MQSQEDVRLARIILKKGWLPKETLEQALREVQKIKEHDSAMTLAHYLGLKELLDWEKIEWVLDLLAAHGSSAGPAAHASAKSQRSRMPGGGRRPGVRGRGRRPAVSRHDDGEHRHHFVRKKQSTTPVVIAFCAAVVVLIGALAFAFLGDDDKKPPRESAGTTATTEDSGLGPSESQAPLAERQALAQVERARDNPREQIRLAKEFIGSYAQSSLAPRVRKLLEQAENGLDADAQEKWRQVTADSDTLLAARKYQHLMDKYRVLADEFKGTTTADKALAAASTIEEKWNQAYRDKMDEIDILRTDRDFPQAISEAQALLAWCPRGTDVLVRQKIEDLETARDAVDVAVADAGPSSAGGGTDTGDDEGLLVDPAEDFGPGDDAGMTGDDEGLLPGGDDEELIPGGDEEGLFPGEDEEELIPGDDEELLPEPEGGTTGGDDEELIDPDDDEDLFGDPDESEDLFGDDGDKLSGAARNNLLSRVIKREGQEKVQKELERIFACSKVVVEKNGRIKIGYDFGSKEERLAQDWTPQISKHTDGKATVRWSAPMEGDLMTVFYGVRISDSGYLIAEPCFRHDFQVEVCFHSAQATKNRSHLIAGVVDKENKAWFGTDFGAQAVRATASGSIVAGDPRIRRESPSAGTVRWFRVDYEKGKLISWLALAGGNRQWIRDRPTFETVPNYRRTGELVLDKQPGKFYPGLIFKPDIVGTVGYVRLTGFLDPEWLKARAKEKGSSIEFDEVGLGDI